MAVVILTEATQYSTFHTPSDSSFNPSNGGQTPPSTMKALQKVPTPSKFRQKTGRDPALAATAERRLSASLVSLTDMLNEKDAALKRLASLHARLLKSHEELTARLSNGSRRSSPTPPDVDDDPEAIADLIRTVSTPPRGAIAHSTPASPPTPLPPHPSVVEPPQPVADEACVDGGAECESDEHVSDDDGGAGGMGGDDGGAGGMGGELVRLLQEEVARLKATQAATSALLEQQEKIGGCTAEDVRLLQERLRTAMAEAERSAKKKRGGAHCST